MPLLSIQGDPTRFVTVLRADLQRLKDSVSWTLAACLVIVLPCLALYYPMRCDYYDWALCVDSRSIVSMIYKWAGTIPIPLLASYFCIVNPLAEEWFWRCFLPLRSSLFKVRLLADMEGGYGSIDQSHSSPSTLSSKHLILISFAYSSYHIAIFWYMAGIVFAIEGGIAVFALGLIFGKVAEKNGVFASAVLHAVVDSAVVVAVLVIG